MSVSLQFQNLRIEGSSRAGDASWFRIHPPGMAFDVGRGSLALAGADDFFLTHGHLDHALGLPFVLSLKRMQGGEEPRVFCPAGAVEGLRLLVEAAEGLEHVDYRYELSGLESGDRVSVGRDLEVEAFATDHIVPSLGFHLIRHQRVLRDEFRERSAAELASLRERGEEIEERTEELWVTYCGDTGPEVFELEPRLFESRVLLLECTFFDPERRNKAEQFKHLHLADIAERARLFHNRDLVLHHASLRYGEQELRSAVERELAEITPRVRLMLS
jgi:ribonuclease Z